jgi:MarR family transcriptional regulator, organic hydroperoxide resistance regulator
MSDYNKYDSIGFLLYRTARAMHLFFNRKMNESGFEISAEQWGLLLMLSEKEGVNQKDISEYTCKDKTYVTRMVDHLEDQGFVLRKESKNDRRNKQVLLTAKGKKLKEKLIPVVQDGIIGEAAKNFSKNELDLFKSLLNKLYENTNEN